MAMSEPLPPSLRDERRAVKLVYRELRDAQDARTYSELASTLHYSRRTVKDATSRLEELALAEQTWAGTQTVAYRVTDRGMGG